MVRMISYYECEYCKSEYNSYDEAAECEEKHIKINPYSFVSDNVKLYYRRDSVYPYQIAVTFSDGTNIAFRKA